MLQNDPYVKKSCEWLKSIQNEDGGWGMFELSPSRIINTAEAVVCLVLAGERNKCTDDGINYLIRTGNSESFCKFTRHHAWIVYALSVSGLKGNIPNRCVEYLKCNQKDGGWADDMQGEVSLFPTFLAARAVHNYGEMDFVKKACDWIIKKYDEEYYWTFQHKEFSLCATSYALITLSYLTENKNYYRDYYKKPFSFLLSGNKGKWSLENQPNVAGDFHHNYHHLSLPWTIHTLLTYGESIFTDKIHHLIKELYFSHYCPQTGGWTEEKEHRPSVFATSHAINAIYSIHQWTSVQELTSIIDKNEIGDSKGSDIFIIHGHDNTTTTAVQHFIVSINCKPLVIEEKTIIGTTTLLQNLLNFASKSAYAIALFIPEDRCKDENGKFEYRVRQNVLFELGFFIGKLGPSRVCIAKKGRIKIPTDLDGALYLDLDSDDWKLRLQTQLYYLGFNVFGE